MATGEPARKKSKRVFCDVDDDHLVVMASAVADIAKILSTFDTEAQHKVLAAVCVLDDYHEVVLASEKGKNKKSPKKSKTSKAAGSSPGSDSASKSSGISDGNAASSAKSDSSKESEDGEIEVKKRGKKKRHATNARGEEVGRKGNPSVPNLPNLIWDEVGNKLKANVINCLREFKTLTAEVPKRKYHTVHLEPANQALRVWKLTAEREPGPDAPLVQTAEPMDQDGGVDADSVD
jgi:hypothetical protein